MAWFHSLVASVSFSSRILIRIKDVLEEKHNLNRKLKNEPKRQAQCGSGQLGGQVVAERVLRQRQLHQVLGQCVVKHVHLVENLRSCLRISSEKVKRQRAPEPKVQRLEHPALHGQHVLTRISLVRHVDKVVDLWCPRLFEFGCDKHGREADQLQFPSVDGGVRLRREKTH